jgi:hypothetical protein
MSLNRIVLLALVVLAAGCFSATSSKLEAGESVEVGRRPFDTYFEEVAAFRDEVKRLDADLFPMREPLVEQLDVSVDAAIGSLMDATSKRVSKGRDFGVMLSLRLTPTPKILVVKGDVDVDDRDQRLFDAIEKSAAIAMAAFRKHTELLEKIAALEERRAKLAEQLEALPPRMEDKRDVIQAEILGAGRILRQAESSLLRNTRTISHYLVALSNAVDTGATESLETKCDEAVAKAAEEPKKPPPAPRWQPAPKWTPPPGPRPAPAPAPAPKPRPPPGGDFEM